jgi:REP element-mobilizing transposase RayT
VRLPEYDYAGPGAYFVTICTHERRVLFGAMVDREMRLSPPGEIVLDCWNAIPDHFAHVALDAFVVMPNHVHGILLFRDHQRRGMACHAPTTTVKRRFSKPPAGALSAVLGSFKSASTRGINRLRGIPGAPIWQRNYHEHVIRNETDLDAIRQYVVDNPLRWHLDEENPERHSHRAPTK